jgi:hypothetical protein
MKGQALWQVSTDGILNFSLVSGVSPWQKPKMRKSKRRL